MHSDILLIKNKMGSFFLVNWTVCLHGIISLIILFCMLNAAAANYSSILAVDALSRALKRNMKYNT